MIKLLPFLVILIVGCHPQVRPTDGEMSDTTTVIDTSVTVVDTLEDSVQLDSIPQNNSFLADIDFVDTTVNLVRILLTKDQSSVTLFSYGRFSVISDERKIKISEGAVTFTVENGDLRVAAHGNSAIIVPPIDIEMRNSEKLFSYDDTDYRGSMRIEMQNENSLMVINTLPVESYLRGVVPLEIGRKPDRDSASMQAQAVAARTYTYKRIDERIDWFYDLLPTVSDQVYGGASAEYVGSDRAILATKNQVMVSSTELVDALYHSTCGGYTASKEDVWGGAPISYLVSRSDMMVNGAPYCGISPQYRWREEWDRNDFTRKITQYSKQVSNQPNFSGTIDSFNISSRARCGRITSCDVSGSNGVTSFSGDKMRFVFRRPNTGNGILKSSNFTIRRENSKIIAEGKGYGHGIGMCQMGAIGRARQGQSYSQILKAYYTNIQIKDINEHNRSSRRQ